jgi:hypothetical protein
MGGRIMTLIVNANLPSDNTLSLFFNMSIEEEEGDLN